MSYLALPPRVTGIIDLHDALAHMTEMGGSDLFISGGEPLWMNCHGAKKQLTQRRLSEKEVESVLQEIYGDNAPARIGSGETIDTFYEYKTDEKVRHRFRLNAVGCFRGGRNTMMVTLRSIPTTPITISELGVEADITNACQDIDQGLILVVGSTGSGKSTLLASILRNQLEAPNGNRNLVTIESPIEFVYDEVARGSSIFTQTEVGRHVHSFSHGVTNALRMAPTDILVGESRDFETITATLEASVTGHVVYSTLHANSVAQTCQRMLKVFDEDLQSQAQQDMVQALKVIVAQRLVPSLDSKRVALREYLIFTDEMRAEMEESKNLAATVKRAVNKHGRPMIGAADIALSKGLISIETRDRIAKNYGE